MVESSDKTRSTGEGNVKPLQYSCLENPMNSMKRQKDRTLKDELPRSVDAPYATGKEWRNNSRKNEGMEPKWKQHPVVDVTGDGSKVWCYKEQYCIGTSDVKFMNQVKLKVVKQEMARVNTDILGISKLKWPVLKTTDHILCSWRWRNSVQSAKTRPGADCGSDHELLIKKFRLKLKKVGKTTRPFRYDWNQIAYNYTVEVTNSFKGLDLRDRVPEELWTELCNIV